MFIYVYIYILKIKITTKLKIAGSYFLSFLTLTQNSYSQVQAVLSPQLLLVAVNSIYLVASLYIP